ncbi:MAG: leucine/isoleucine/valine transporter permease subunit [Actinomycetota bacterium]|nr:leucine/isoleucine/valine transporter permease subunit [Actinomycetota bacterium]
MKSPAYTRRLGLIAGTVMSFTGAIGMIQTFNERTLINPYLRMGDLTLYMTPFVLAWLAARGEPNPLHEPEREPMAGAAQGAVVGLIAGALTSVFLLVINTFDLTEFFPNMRPATIDAMTFDLGVPVGLVVLTAVSAFVGAAGGYIFGLPEHIRRGLGRATGWVLAFALFEVVVADILSFADIIVDVIYGPRGGLQIWSAVIIGALAWWLSARYQGQVKEFSNRVRGADAKSRLRRSMIALGVFAAIVLPMLLGGILNELLVNVSIFILMGLGLNIVVGYAGLLDLGYVAFFAVGAYGTAVLTSTSEAGIGLGLNWWLALPIVLVMASIAGLMVGTPVIRMRGDYLAIVTLGFGEIVRILLLSDWLTPFFGGAQGIRRIPGIPVPFIGEVSGTDPQLFIYFMLLFVGLAVYISYRAQNSRIGRSWAAMREDEDVAEATGISTVQAKLLAFVAGAIVASFAGALFSAKVGTVFTNSFDVLVSIIILVLVIVGGMGSIPGVMVGALVLIGILGGPKSPGLLQEFSEFKLLIYGGLLVFMMLTRPEGLIPSVRRSRELHADELTQDAWLDKGGDFARGDGEEVAT